MKWFDLSVRNEAAGAVASIVIDGVIGGGDWFDDSGVSSAAFMNAVKELGDVSAIMIDMNSPGGSVADGLTIANYLRNHAAPVTVNVLGQASSIASVITAAADTVNMGVGAYMFVHNPFTVGVGNAEQLRALAQDLDTIATGIIDVYVARVGEDSRAQLEEYVNGPDGDGTLLSASMAVDLGLADSMLETRAAASTVALTDAITHARDEAQRRLQEADASQPLTPSEAFQLAFDCDAEYVEANIDDLVAQIIAYREAEPAPAPAITRESLEANHGAIVTAIRDDAVQAALESERGRTTGIIDACAAVDQMALASRLIENGMERETALQYVADVAAAADPSIHNANSPEGGQSSGIDTGAVYARRKNQAMR